MTNAASEKYRKFVGLLYEKTTKRDVHWQIGFGDSLNVVIAKNRLNVFLSVNSNREDLVVFELFNDQDDKADTFNDEDLISFDAVPYGFENWYSLCKAIYDLGTRYATGADTVLDAMIDVLDDEVIF